jgi:hypothetical protein
MMYPMQRAMITLQFFIKTDPKSSMPTRATKTENPKPMYAAVPYSSEVSPTLHVSKGGGRVTFASTT